MASAAGSSASVRSPFLASDHSLPRAPSPLPWVGQHSARVWVRLPARSSAWAYPEEDAKYYEGEAKAGRTLVTVKAGDRYG